MSGQPVLLEIENHIAVVTLNRPKALNSLSKVMRDALITTFERIKEDGSVRVVILTGAGRAFCAGLDLKEIEQDGLSENDLGITAPFIQIMEEFSIPIIGAINGYAITGGFELALLSDFMIAAESAKFADTHGRVGIVPGWGLSQKLPRIIGIQRAKELSFTGNFLEARQAEQWGLVNRVVPDEGLMTAARELARDIASCDPVALKEIKQLIDSGYSGTLADGLSMESESSKDWSKKMDAASIGERRKAVQARGRKQ